jgi:hypothetical protein
MDKYILNTPGDYAVLSVTKPSEGFTKRFTLLSLLFFCKRALIELASEDHPHHMDVQEIATVTKFLDLLFTYNPETDMDTIANHPLGTPSFSDYVNHTTDMVHENKGKEDQLYPYSYTVDTKQLHSDEEGRYNISLGEHHIPIPSMDAFISWDQFTKLFYNDLTTATRLLECS